jgi:hypothetical protein
MAETNFFCNFGESTCTPAPDITRADQHSVLERFLLPWLDCQLKAECDQGQRFDQLTQTDTAVIADRNCSLCATTGISDPEYRVPRVFPVPLSDYLFVDGVTMQSGDTWALYDAAGRCVLNEEVAAACGRFQIRLPELSSGTYLLQWTRAKAVRWSGPLVR